MVSDLPPPTPLEVGRNVYAVVSGLRVGTHSNTEVRWSTSTVLLKLTILQIQEEIVVIVTHKHKCAFHQQHSMFKCQTNCKRYSNIHQNAII